MSARLCSGIRRHRAATGLFAMDFARALGISESRLARGDNGSEPLLEQTNDIKSLLELRKGQLLMDAGFVDPPDREWSQARS